MMTTGRHMSFSEATLALLAEYCSYHRRYPEFHERKRAEEDGITKYGGRVDLDMDARLTDEYSREFAQRVLANCDLFNEMLVAANFFSIQPLKVLLARSFARMIVARHAGPRNLLEIPNVCSQ